MGPKVDRRLPLSDAPKLAEGWLEVAGKIVAGEDPIKAVQEGLAKGIAALGVDALRREHAQKHNQ